MGGVELVIVLTDRLSDTELAKRREFLKTLSGGEVVKVSGQSQQSFFVFNSVSGQVDNNGRPQLWFNIKWLNSDGLSNDRDNIDLFDPLLRFECVDKALSQLLIELLESNNRKFESLKTLAIERFGNLLFS